MQLNIHLFRENACPIKSQNGDSELTVGGGTLSVLLSNRHVVRAAGHVKRFRELFLQTSQFIGLLVTAARTFVLLKLFLAIIIFTADFVCCVCAHFTLMGVHLTSCCVAGNVIIEPRM